MAAEEHHLAYVWIIGIVFIVAVAGAYMLKGPVSPTGNVVYVSDEDPCSSCSGSPVCAVRGQTAYNYENACAAACDGAKVIYADVCERI